MASPRQQRDPPSNVTVHIKVAPYHTNNGSDHVTLGDFAVGHKIGDVRTRIQETLPRRPLPERQRLLYAGRALVDNDQSLADAFNIRRDPEQLEYTMHLVVKEPPGMHNGPTGPLPQARSVPQPPRFSTDAPNTFGGVQQQATQGQGGHAGIPPGGIPFPGMGFNQALGHQQQQRAAMGMQGVGPQFPIPQRAQGMTTSSDAAGQDSRRQDTDVRQHSTDQTGHDGTGQGTQGQGTQGFHQQPHQPGVPRPVSGQGYHMQGIGPNGSRFAIHQHTMQFPGGPNPPFHGFPPGMQFPQNANPPFPQYAPGMQNIQLPFPLSGGMPPMQIPNAPPQPVGPSALERARENLTEMRRMLDEMRDEGNVSDDQRTRLESLRQSTEALDRYIEPFGLPNDGISGRRSAPPTQQPGQGQNFPLSDLHQRIESLQARQQAHRRPSRTTHQPSSSSDTTCYLLSGPQGPQALLFSPQHGAYTGSFPRSNAHPVLAGAIRQPAPTQTQRVNVTQTQQNGAQIQGQGQGQGNVVAANAPDAPAAPADADQQQANAAQVQGPMAPLQPFIAHLWFLFRILIFAYFLLGSSMGWRRPLFLVAVAAVYWLIRIGVLNAQNGLGGAVRGWWDGLVGVPAGRREEPRREGDGQGLQGREGGAAAAADNVRREPGQMPTPEQVAERLLREQRERTGPQPWWRDQLRPVERAVALFVASLWPGVGEAHVRAREEEERRRNEEEVAEARRQAERAAVALEQQQQQQQQQQNEASDGAAGNGLKATGLADQPSTGTNGDGAPASASGVSTSTDRSNNELRARDNANSGSGGPNNNSSA